jgi:Arc/MetJ-type ribon-helix-helix transcriptional regulator
MTTAKMSKTAISLPTTLMAHAKRVVKMGRASSVSGYIAKLIENDSRAREEFIEMLNEMKAEVGEPSAEDRAWARRVAGLE